jgi:CheY-like chemotaxis protein
MTEETLEKDILLAEDDIDDAEIFTMAMGELKIPYVMRRAENGDVLFVLLKERVPYILFLDIHMPCRDGLSCIVEIRKNRQYDKLPVVMYTSHLSQKIIEESYRNGANLYLTKTVIFADLVKNLKKIFEIDWKNYLHFPPQDQFVLS